MQVAHPAALAAAVALAAVAAASPARAQSASAKIGVVNVAAVSGKILEIKDFQAHIQNQQQLYDAAVKGHQAQVEDMKNALRNVKPDSDAFESKFGELQETVGRFNMDDQLRKQRLLQEVNKQNKLLFLEIQQVVGGLAKQKGLDLVIVEPEVQLPTSVQNVDPQQLNNLISQKTILYASPKVDLTDEVATAMDANYKAHGAAGGSSTPSH